MANLFDPNRILQGPSGFAGTTKSQPSTLPVAQNKTSTSTTRKQAQLQRVRTVVNNPPPQLPKSEASYWKKVEETHKQVLNETGFATGNMLNARSTTPFDDGSFSYSTLPKVVREVLIRTPARVGLDFYNVVNPKNQIFEKSLVDPTAPKWEQDIANVLFGKDPIKSLSMEIAERELSGQSTPRAIFTTASLAALDFTGLGGAKGAIKALKGIKTEGEAFLILKQMGVADDIAEAYSKTFAQLDDEKAIQKAIKTMEELQRTTTNPQVFKGFPDLTTKVLEKLKGRSQVSKQFISDLTNSPDLKQAERNLIRRALQDEGETVDIPKFANKVKTELLPLKREPLPDARYENISLPEDLRGSVANYQEHMYDSPIQTSAGSVHFGKDETNYFAHTRIEDLANYTGEAFGQKGLPASLDERLGKTGTTRRVIEIQSDLFQKGRLESSLSQAKDEVVRVGKTDWKVVVNNDDTYTLQAQIPREKMYKNGFHKEYTFMGKKYYGTVPTEKVSLAEMKQKFPELYSKISARLEGGLPKLEPYRNTWHERIIREEIKQAAIDGKTKLQFPTGETAMKIEGLGENTSWRLSQPPIANAGRITPDNLKVGLEIVDEGRPYEGWIITDVLGDGKFKAVPKKTWDDIRPDKFKVDSIDQHNLDMATETFDISGKVDTSNPIYRFYEKEVGKYLSNKYQAKRIKDAQGVEWWEVDITKNLAGQPVEAFGAVAGFEMDEEGNISFNPEKAALGLAGVGALKSRKINAPAGLRQADSAPSLLGSRSKATAQNPLESPKSPLSSKSSATGPSSRIGDLDKSSVAKRISSFIDNVNTKVLKVVQDEAVKVRKLVARKDLKITDKSDPYLKATLYHGRASTKIEESKKQIEAIFKEAKSAKVSRKEISDYLYYRHAPERNLSLGEKAAGITSKEAEEAFKALKPEVKEFAERLQKIHNESLEILRDSGVISEELFDTLRKKYKNHVPLQRIFDETEDIGGVLSGRGFDVRSTGIKKAVGSEREVDDIVTNIVTNYEQAVLRAEKNIVDQATLALVRDNKKIFGDTFQIIKPKAIGQTFDGKPILQKTQDPTILQMFENGKPVWIKIADKHLAVALRGVGRWKSNPIMDAVGFFTRFYAGLHTRFNLEFALSNKIRDLQETAVYLAAQKEMGFKGASKAILRDIKQQNTLAIIDYLRGADTEGARLYKEMRDLGGTTGGLSLSTKKRVGLDLKKMEKLANSKTRRLGHNLIEYVDNWNTIFEDSTRLSVYRQALEQGLTKERAAAMAKEASINFNRMGTGGPMINALYMFSNASIQGTTKMLRSLKNPKVLGATVLTVGASVAAVSEWNDNLDPEWRTKVSKWDRLNSLTVLIPTPDGQGVKYINIPVSWGIKPIKVMADYAYDAVSGQEFDPKKMVIDATAAIWDAYNPVGGTDFISGITPTILDIPVEIGRNKSWSGSQIKPTKYDPNMPEDIRYFDSLKETKLGQTTISITEMLQEKGIVSISPADLKYGFEQAIGGAGRTISKTVNTITGFATGQPVPIDEYPFLSRFYRERTEEEVNRTGKSDQYKEILEQQERDSKEQKNEAESFLDNLKTLPKEEQKKQLLDIAKNDPLLYGKVKDVTEQRRKNALPPTDRQLIEMNIGNGVRAKTIWAEVEKLESREEKKAYLKDLVKKKIITDEVWEQIKYLAKNKKTSSVQPKRGGFSLNPFKARTASAAEIRSYKLGEGKGDFEVVDGRVVPNKIGKFKSSIIAQESKGRYSAIGADTKHGKALGKYQIIPKFWFHKIKLNPNSEADKQKFLKTPKLQDQLFSIILDESITRYKGNLRKVAAAYYGGGAGAAVVDTKAGDAPQYAWVNGKKVKMPSINQYVREVMSRL